MEINKAYPSIYAARLVRGTTLTFLLAILKYINHVKIYMPEVNPKDFQDHLIIAINTRFKRYTLTYKGRCKEDLLHKLYLEPDT